MFTVMTAATGLPMLSIAIEYLKYVAIGFNLGVLKVGVTRI